MIIYVSKHDIKNGLIGSSDECMISLAIRRKIRNKYVATIGTYIYIDGESFVTSDSLFDKIKKFDACQEVKPFKFSLDFKNKKAAIA